VSDGLKKGRLMIAKMQMRLDIDMIAQVVPLNSHPKNLKSPKYKNAKARGTFFWSLDFRHPHILIHA